MLLLIDNHDSFSYNLVELLRDLAIPFRISTIDQLNLDDVEKVSHVLISPGPDIPLCYPKLFELLLRYHKHKSILGVCLGHQTICQFFGAQLYNLDFPMHGKQQQIQIEMSSILFENLPRSFNIGLYHSWAVAENSLPDCLQITASSYPNNKIIMAVQHRVFPIYGVQFHPESFMSEYGKSILQNWFAYSFKE